MRYTARVGDRTITVGVEEAGQERSVTLDDASLAVTWNAAGADGALTGPFDAMAGHYGILAEERSYDAFVRPLAETDEESGGAVFEVMIEGRPYRVVLQDERTRALQSLAGAGHAAAEATLRAPMPGLVVNVMVAPGDQVTRGQTIAVLQAMKMENDLAAPRDGVVKAVRVQGGQTVNQNDVLAVIGAAGEAASESSEDEDEIVGE